MYAAAAKEKERQRKSGETTLPDSVKSAPIHAAVEAAKSVGASKTSVIQAKAVQRDAPDLAEKVKAGQMALDAADFPRNRWP